MRIGVIEGANHHIAPPKKWNEERDGKCEPLAVLVGGGALMSMTSAWFPTPEEIELIVNGAPIHLEVVGISHPPVLLTVGKVPS